MTGHRHAALMAEYAKDATETQTPWERWEVTVDFIEDWRCLGDHPEWNVKCNYRRKRIPLCQIEGCDVFAGDRLYFRVLSMWVTAVRYDVINGYPILWVGSEEKYCKLSDLSWNIPAPSPKPKTLYKWAFISTDENWYESSVFAADETEFRKLSGLEGFKVHRLDYTAIEV